MGLWSSFNSVDSPLCLAVALWVPWTAGDVANIVGPGEASELSGTVLGTIIINPRRACAARVTVLGLSVCLSVCLSTLILAVQATTRPMSDTSSLRATKA